MSLQVWGAIIMATIANMTLDELKQFVDAAIDERLTRMLGAFELPDPDVADENLTWDAIREMVERHRWTPPPGAKSAVEMLREDRDS
jgi:hypothetical protein